MNKRVFFISGIDTGCGKTYITGLLAYHLLEAKVKVITTKLVQTGGSGVSEDIIEHRKLMEIDILAEDKIGLTCPFVYSYPSSPHLAAEVDKHPFHKEVITESTKKLLADYDIILSEGAGGLTVPLTKDYFISDYIIENKLPVILVSSSKLGSINHTLLSIDFCRQKKINLIAVIYNEMPENDTTIAIESFSFIKNYLKGHNSNIKLIHSQDLCKNSKINVYEKYFSNAGNNC